MWWAVAPRADQPLADSLERLLPSLRGIYMTEREIAVVDEAAAYAERYRTEAERLNAVETESRWHGRVLSDDELRKMSSFLQSYNEMRKGEEFVQREARARARERHRWRGGLLGLLLALPIAPLHWRRRRYFRLAKPGIAPT